MKKEIFSYLANEISQDPTDIDGLFVAAFIKLNNLQVRRSKFLTNYLVNTLHSPALTKFLSIYNSKKMDLEDLIQLFEFVVSPEDRVVNGAVYTPKTVREFITDNCFDKVKLEETTTICDWACGCGSFLLTAAKKIKETSKRSYQSIFAENIFGVDVEDYAITRSKILLSLLALSEGEDENLSFNLHQGNSLSFNWKRRIKTFPGFDIVIGNPPYVCSRNIDPETKELLTRWSVSSTGHPDLYIPFFQIGIESLNPTGILGFITMNTFFKSLNGRAVRDYFATNKFDIKIIDFGKYQVFADRNTYTCICFIQKQPSETIAYTRSEKSISTNENLSFKIIPYTELNKERGWNLDKNDLINKIQTIGKTFSEIYKTRNGIATLKNDIYIFKPVDEDKDFYYLQNGSLFPIEKGICQDIINPNKLTRESDLEKLRKKIIFPYDRTSKRPLLIEEKILRDNYPETYTYLKGKKKVLATRDKGNGEYESWYAYGRRQSLEKIRHKLFLPHITSSTPNFVIDNNDDLLFYNGIAVVADSEEELLKLKYLLESRLFWFYIVHSSKPYFSGYYSLSRNYLKDFGVYEFSAKDIQALQTMTTKKERDIFIERKYGISSRMLEKWQKGL